MSILVRHAMTEAPTSLGSDRPVAEAARVMKDVDTGVVPVVDGQELRGLVTDRDLVLRVLAEGRSVDTPLTDILTESPFTVTPDQQLSEARELMAAEQIRRLPVMKGGVLVGILSLGDVALEDASERAVGEAVEEISKPSDPPEPSGVPAAPPSSGGPARGTPERVAKAQRAAEDGELEPDGVNATGV